MQHKNKKKGERESMNNFNSLTGNCQTSKLGTFKIDCGFNSCHIYLLHLNA